MAFQVAEFEVAMGIYKAGAEYAIQHLYIIACFRFGYKFHDDSLFCSNEHHIFGCPASSGMQTISLEFSQTHARKLQVQTLSK
jgi:hypothetical protein